MVFLSSYRESETFTVVVVTAAVFTDTLIYSLVIPLLPAILLKRAKVKEAQLETWISIMLGSYGAAALLSPAIIGPLTDRFKFKKLLFTLGLLVLIAATFLFFLGHHVVVLVVGRALYGLSTTMVFTSGMTFLSLRLGGKHSGSAMGIVMTGSSGGDLIGPAVGGLMYDAYGEAGVFAIAGVAVIFDIILRLLMLDPPTKPEDPKNEPLLAEVRRRGEEHWNGEEPPGGEAEPETGDRIINSSRKGQSGYRILLTNINFLTSVWVLFVGTCARSGLETTVPLFIKSAFGWSEGEAGLVLLIMFAPSLLSSFFARLKPRWPTSLAFIVMGLMYIALGFATSNRIPVKVVFGLLMFGIGTCFYLTSTVHMSAMSAIASETEMKDEDNDSSENATTSSGKAFALMNQALAAGLLVGPMWAGPLDDRFGWLPMCVSFTAACLLSGGTVSLGWREDRQRSS